MTDPFQIMYHEVPLSPWLNTERSTDQTGLGSPPLLCGRCHVQTPGAQLPVPHLTYTRSLLCCVVQRAELPLIPASPVRWGEEGQCGESGVRGARLAGRLGPRTRVPGGRDTASSGVWDSAGDNARGGNEPGGAEGFLDKDAGNQKLDGHFQATGRRGRKRRPAQQLGLRGSQGEEVLGKGWRQAD